MDPASGAQAQQEDPNIAAAKELDFLGKECVYIYIYKHIQKSVDKYSYMYNGKLFEISEHTPETVVFEHIYFLTRICGDDGEHRSCCFNRLDFERAPRDTKASYPNKSFN